MKIGHYLAKEKLLFLLSLKISLNQLIVKNLCLNLIVFDIILVQCQCNWIARNTFHTNHWAFRGELLRIDIWPNQPDAENVEFHFRKKKLNYLNFLPLFK